jgi:hypothetical protein
MKLLDLVILEVMYLFPCDFGFSKIYIFLGKAYKSHRIFGEKFTSHPI